MDLKVALIEIGGSHEECMLSQMVALKQAGAHLTLICTAAIKDRNPHFSTYIDEYLIIKFPGKALQDFKLMQSVNRYLVANKISKVVLNTAQGGHIRNLCLTASRKVEFTGIIHTIRKFQGSFTQKLIHSKVKKYLVLSDFLLEKIHPPKGIRVQSFYPLEYPRFGITLEKPAGETWITITGGVENRRKDLEGFIEMLAQIGDETVKFIFLGKSDLRKEEVIEFKRKLEAIGKIKQVLFFEDFVSPELFDAYITHTDFLCPLIHPGTQSAEQYISNQISGAFNLAYSYHIPMLIHEAYHTVEDLQLSSFFYETADFAQTLERAIAARAARAGEISVVKKWDKSFQQEKFLDFIL